MDKKIIKIMIYILLSILFRWVAFKFEDWIASAIGVVFIIFLVIISNIKRQEDLEKKLEE